MSDASRHKMSAIAEVTYGLTPATPALKIIRHTGTNLGLSKTTIVSEEIRPDRQIEDMRHGTKQIAGDIMAEVSYASHDDFLEAALCGTWAVKAAPYAAATISAASGDNSINDSANGLPVLTAGDKVTIAGFTGTPANNKAKYVVVSSTNAKMVLAIDADHVALVTDAAGESVTVTALTFVLKAGVQRRSFSILRQFTDQDGGAKPFYRYMGAEVNKLALTVAVNAIVKAVYSFIGQDMAAPSTTEPADTTYVDPNTNSPMDAFSGIIYEGGSPIAVVTELSVALENGIGTRFVVGSELTIRPGIQRSNCTANLTVYFEDSSMVEKFVNETTSSLVFYLGDLAGNKYRVTLPRLKYTGGQPDVSGQASITLAMPIQALLDSVTGTNIMVERIAA